MLNKLKDDILRLLKEDEEFRYAVIGLLGLQRLEEAVIELKNVVVRMEERLAKVEERLEGHDRKFNAILAELRDLRKELSDLKSKHDKRLSNIEAYMERTSLTLEEEAREVIEYRLREKGIAITNISSLILEDMEIDIYAADTNLCLIGEASTRVSAKLIEEVDKDIEKLCKEHPEYLKDKVIKVVYGMQVLPDAVDEARKRGIWLVTANKEVTELNIR
jgi:chromosome segregation ATPase